MPQNVKPAGGTGGHQRIVILEWRAHSKNSLQGFLSARLPSGLDSWAGIYKTISAGQDSSMESHNSDVLVDEKAAAQRLGLSVSTLRRRRLLRQTPTFVKLGARVLYQAEDLSRFVADNIVRPSDAGGRQAETR
jgi:predicted DNA-binding transcriptional regulator AlpA